MDHQLLVFYVYNFSFLAGNQLWLINEGLFFDLTVLTVAQFRCCGVTNHTDWFEVYNATRVPDSCCLEYSDNCGLDNPGTWWTAVSSCSDSKGGNLNTTPVFGGLATPFSFDVEAKQIPKSLDQLFLTMITNFLTFLLDGTKCRHVVGLYSNKLSLKNLN